MKELLKLIWLTVVLAFRRWQLSHARQFRAGLEVTIVKERIRAQEGVDHAEYMERQAVMAIVASRADKRIPENAATETR